MPSTQAPCPKQGAISFGSHARCEFALNFNPLHRDFNRDDQRMLWNAILNWQAIVSAGLASSKL
jgi:hypothetical protein